jgi:hypothetical protein
MTDERGGSLSWPLQRILYGDAGRDEVLLFARRMRTGGKPWYVIGFAAEESRLTGKTINIDSFCTSRAKPYDSILIHL